MSRREDILARLAVIIGTIDGVETAARNLDRIADTKLPAAILFDGDEEVLENPRAISGRPNAVTMLPAIVVSLGDVPENVGTVTNDWLAMVQRAVLLDETIPVLCGRMPTSGARYASCTTSLMEGRTSEVNLSVHFTITYAFEPSKL